MASLNYLINDVKGNEILARRARRTRQQRSGAAIADAVNEVDPTYGIAVEYLSFVETNSSPIFPPPPSYAGTAQTEYIQLMAEECLLKGTSITAAEAAETLVDGINEIAESY